MSDVRMMFGTIIGILVMSILAACATEPRVSSEIADRGECAVSWDMAQLPADDAFFECQEHRLDDGLVLYSAELQGNSVSGSAMVIRTMKPQPAEGQLVDMLLRKEWLVWVLHAENVGPPHDMLCPWGETAEVRRFKLHDQECLSWAGHDIREDARDPKRVWINGKLGHVCGTNPERLLNAVQYSWDA